MQPPDSRFDIASEADLLQLFDAPKEVSLVKELDRIDANYAAGIAASPFFVLCTQQHRARRIAARRCGGFSSRYRTRRHWSSRTAAATIASIAYAI